MAGIAVTAAVPSYPQACGLGCFNSTPYNPGLVWATQADAGRIAAGGRRTRRLVLEPEAHRFSGGKRIRPPL